MAYVKVGTGALARIKGHVAARRKEKEKYILFDAAASAFLKQVRDQFGDAFAKQVALSISEKTGKEIQEMAKCDVKCKSLYVVYVVDQEADTVEPPDYVIATGEENARYKVLHAKDVKDPDELDVFVQFIGALKNED